MTTEPLMRLTDETHPDRPHLRRLAFTRDHGMWREGDKGGWAECDRNVTGNAMVTGGAWVSGDARVYGNAQVYGSAEVYGDAQVYGSAEVTDSARVTGNAQVYGNARVTGAARVTDSARVYGNAVVSGNAWVHGSARVTENSRVTGDAVVTGEAWVTGDARIACDAEVLFVSDVSTDHQHATLTRTTTGHNINIGCWGGTVTDLHALADSDHWPSGCDKATRNKHRDWLHAVANLCEARISLWEPRNEEAS